VLRAGLTLRTAIACVTLAVLVVAVFTVMLVAILDQRSSRDSAVQARAQLSMADRLLTLLVVLETGQRGFVITRKQSLLEPWDAALTTLPADVRALARDAENPIQSRRARAIARSIDDYSSACALCEPSRCSSSPASRTARRARCRPPRAPS
jgi:CHASE3 domain sensor protein